MKTRDKLNRYSLVYRVFSRTIMVLGHDGYFHEHHKKERGVLVKRIHCGQTWYHFPDDYLQWKPNLTSL